MLSLYSTMGVYLVCNASSLKKGIWKTQENISRSNAQSQNKVTSTVKPHGFDFYHSYKQLGLCFTGIFFNT